MKFDEKLVLGSLILLILPIVSIIPYALAFMASSSIGYADINNTCRNDNSSSSCYALESSEMRESHFEYSLVGGAGGQHSPNFSYGYLLGFDRGFGHRTNNTYIMTVANATGWDLGGQNTTALPSPPCTVSNLFCVSFTTAYEQSYTYHIPCWVGNATGEKYADHVIDTCTQKNYPDFRLLNHHTAQYKQGFLDGYSDSVAGVMGQGVVNDAQDRDNQSEIQL
ncbi:MAG: hypothetical protein WCC17_13195 [Candidatus Nitrosopolaris sp.]